MATEATKYTCVVCLNDFEATQPARTCSPRCRKRYQRYRQNGGEELPYRVVAVTPRHTDVTPDKTPDEQATLSNEQMELLRQLVTDMATIKAVMFAIAGGQPFGDQKKSDMVMRMMEDQLKNIDPPTVTFDPNREATPEEIARIRRNTLSALDEF